MISFSGEVIAGDSLAGPTFLSLGDKKSRLLRPQLEAFLFGPDSNPGLSLLPWSGKKMFDV